MSVLNTANRDHTTIIHSVKTVTTFNSFFPVLPPLPLELRTLRMALGITLSVTRKPTARQIRANPPMGWVEKTDREAW